MLRADLYPISIYIIFSQVASISSRFLSSCRRAGVSIYDIFRNRDKGTWQKHLEWCKIVDPHPQVCPWHHCRGKNSLRWKSISTYARTHAQVSTKFRNKQTWKMKLLTSLNDKTSTAIKTKLKKYRHHIQVLSNMTE